MKLSFHNHTNYSSDCKISLAQLEERCVALGIDAITITDHHTTRGAFEAQKRLKRIKVIVGQEIETTEGEVIGLFLTKEIERGMPLESVLKQIHDQGGVSVVPHPFDRLRHHVLSRQGLVSYLASIDLIEVFNSRTVFNEDNRRAAEFAASQAKPLIVGNDAHTVGELGLTIIDLPEFTDGPSFLKAMTKAKFQTRKAPVWVHGITKLVKWESRLRHGQKATS